MGEDQNIEYKQAWRDEYLKWICGFANAQGGKIFIGIDDDGKVTGVEDYKKLMDEIKPEDNARVWWVRSPLINCLVLLQNQRVRGVDDH
jgi:predicted HTH transcriptional regulator